MTIIRKRRHEAMLEQGMHSGNTDAKFDPPPDPRIAEQPADYVTQKEIVRRMGAGINSGTKEVQKMRKHPKFPKAAIGGKWFWPSVVDFLQFWNGRTVEAPGISAGQEKQHGQAANTGRARPRLAAAKERLGRDMDRLKEGA